MPETGKQSLQDSIDSCIKQGLPFVFYRLPESIDIHFMGEAIQNNNIFPEGSGFIFKPFQPITDSPEYFIRNDFHFLGEIDDFDSIRFRIEDVCGRNSTAIQITKKDYCKQIEKAVSAIKTGKFAKVILSRVEEVKNIETEPLKIFAGLCKKYNSAFISLVVIPGITAWLTASPELLVSLKGDFIRTVSLAGTKPSGMSLSWEDKEKTEQQIVTDYIEGILKKHCVDISISGPESVIAGNVMHLKTEFNAVLTSGLKQLVNDLHPTPAICGMPKDKALEFINSTELHQRKYYAGYIGPYNMDGKTELFVNLRCAELMPGKANLYIGGGITADSDPEKEWKETVMKAQTLLSVIAPTVKAV
ncbi:MAG: chorismate-binding protein [Bacteroidia bacterium]